MQTPKTESEKTPMQTPETELEGLKLPQLPPEVPEQEPVYLMEAFNGVLVRVPRSKLGAWLEGQERRKKQPGLSRYERKFVDRIISDLYGSQK